MATSPISSSGSSGGINVQDIVTQLMQVESQSLTKLQQKEAGYQAKISAYGAMAASVTSLQTAVNALKNSSVGMSASVSDSSFFTASASTTATAGTYNLMVNNIAGAQSMYSARFGSQTGEVADLASNPSQRIKIQVGTSSSVITINSTNNTLSGLRDAINSANIGVNAAIVKESSNFVIETGKNDTIKYSDGTNTYTAKIAAGNYAGADLAAAIQTALGSAKTGGGASTTNTFTVDYGTTSLNRFTIKNTAGPAVTIDWANSTAIPQQLGFITDSGASSIGAGASLTASDTVDGTYKLNLVSNLTGTANRIKITVDKTGAGFTDTSKLGLSMFAFDPIYGTDSTNSATYGIPQGGVQNMTQTAAGLDAKLKYNGIEVYRASNSITDLAPGVTLNLLKGDPANYALASPTSVTLTVAQDNSALSGKLSSLVSAYNSAMNTLNKLKGNQNQLGALSGDSTLNTLRDMLRNITTTFYGTSATYSTLFSIGLTHDKNGVLSFDASKLSTGYATNASDITRMVNNMASTLGSSMDNYVNTVLPAGQDGYQTLMKDVQKKELNMQEQLSLKQQAYIKKFNALNTLLTQMQGTGDYVTQQMAALAKGFGGK